MALDAVDESERYGKQVAALFQSCMDTDAINETSAAPLLAIIGSGANLELPALVVSLLGSQQGLGGRC